MADCTRHSNLIFRVAVREVEAWLLADKVNLAGFLHVPERFFPGAPDEIADPKAALLNLARRSRLSDIKGSLLPKRGSTAHVGPGYNECLGGFVRNRWGMLEPQQGDLPALPERCTGLNLFAPSGQRSYSPGPGATLIASLLCAGLPRGKTPQCCSLPGGLRNCGPFLRSSGQAGRSPYLAFPVRREYWPQREPPPHRTASAVSAPARATVRGTAAPATVI